MMCTQKYLIYKMFADIIRLFTKSNEFNRETNVSEILLHM